MRALITGSSGFIGTALADVLMDSGHAVAGIDRHRGNATTHRADLLEPGAFAATIRETRPDVVVHLAAQVGRLFGEDDVRATVRSNAEMTATVATVCGDTGVRLMYASTSEVYGDQADATCVEDGPLLLPHNAYGLTKRWGEEICRLYMPADSLTVMRFSMPYGPGVAPGRGRRAMDTMLWQAQHSMPITVHRGAERSWCWIGDVVAAIRLLLEGEHDGAFNIGRDDDPRSMLWLAQQACELAEVTPDMIEVVDPPAMQTVIKRLSTEKLRGLGWKPTVEIHDGLAEMAAWVTNFDRDGRYMPLRAAA